MPTLRNPFTPPLRHKLWEQTDGQVLRGDARSLRGTDDPDYETMWERSLTPQKVLKLACRCEIDGIEDCVATLLGKEQRSSVLRRNSTCVSREIPVSFRLARA